MRDGELLAATPLFQGSTVEEIEGMLGCLGMRERAYSTGERIHRMGDRIREVGLVLEGSVRIESVDVWGNVSVMGMRGSGQIFGEAYAAIPDEPLMVDVVAAEDCRIMFLTVSKVLTTCSRACPNVREPNGHHRAAEPRSFAANLPRCAQDHPQQGARLPVGPGGTRRLARVRHPLQSPAARRLPRRGPQRPVS